MEIRFDRDLRHNYMVLCGLKTREDYRLRMLAENRLQGLLSCSCRDINGVGYLYYEIDSRQPMRNRYADKRLDGAAVRELLTALRRLSGTLEEYLLDLDHILFSVDCVYVDMRTGAYAFAYCPFDEADGKPAGEPFSAFAEQLLDFLDPEDATAGLMLYTLCEISADVSVRIVDAVQAALEAGGEDGEREKKETGGEGNPGAEVYLAEAPPQVTRDPQVFEPVDDWEEDETPEVKKKRGLPVLTICFALVFAGNLAIRRFLYLSETENLLSLATACVSILMGIISFLIWMKGGRSSEDDVEDYIDARTGELSGGSSVRKRKRKGETADEKENGQWIAASFEDAALEGDPAGVRRGGGPAGTDRPKERAMRFDGGEEETTVLNPEEVPCGGKLYGRNGDRTVNIPLDHLPLTVGKLAACADFCIRDASVSRMHVRFSGDGVGAATQMKDLNSTNGTFLNGSRLQPNETVSIRPGDEIGIGRLVFEYR